MRFVIRPELGGFITNKAASKSLKSFERLADIEITKPFVLFTGPNGAGKTALISMMRASMGLCGFNSGRFFDSSLDRPAPIEDCDGDLGKLAAFGRRFHENKLPDGAAGVLDVKVLGWEGQRSWLFNSRTASNLPSLGYFLDTSSDVDAQVSAIFRSRDSSHGQFLRGEWISSLRFALGALQVPDPYDANLDAIPAVRRALWEACVPDVRRSEERWVLLDEPEVALDIEAIMKGICFLINSAEIGKFRVFCASHSPLFAAGLADHPNVQVIDLGEDGNWFDAQRRALVAVRSLESIAKVSDSVIASMISAEENEKEMRRLQKLLKVQSALEGIERPILRSLAAALENENGTLPPLMADDKKFQMSKLEKLAERKLVQGPGWSAKRILRADPLNYSLTQFGREAAEYMASILKEVDDTKATKSAKSKTKS